MDVGIEERKVAIEIIATLVYRKSRMVELILEPASIPASVYRPIFKQRNPVTGKELTKREMGELILDALENRPDGLKAILEIIKIAASWTEEKYYLADKEEYRARAIVQKARSMLGTVQLLEEQDARQQDQRNEALARIERDHEKERLRKILEDLWVAKDVRYRGYQLEILLRDTFNLYHIPMHEPFRRNHGSEQIDGAFKLEGWYYLVECKWQTKQADSSQVDAFRGKVTRTTQQMMGLFLSINGWTEGVITTLKQNRDKCIILMNGQDLYYLLTNSQADLRAFLLAKNDALSLKCEPFLGIADYLQQS